MLVAISTDFKDSAWSFSSLLKIHISADLHTIRDHIVVSDRPVLRRRERKGARTWPSFVKTRPQREYLYTTLEMAVEEQRGRGIIRFYEATMYFASRVTLEILRPPFNSLVQRISLAIVPRFRGRRTFRRVCPFLFRVRAKRSENSVGGVWSLLLNFNTTGGEGTGVVMKFPPTLFSHQQNKYFPSYERQQFNLVAGGEEAGNWFLGHGTFRNTTHSRRNNERVNERVWEREKEREGKYSEGIVISYKYLYKRVIYEVARCREVGLSTVYRFSLQCDYLTLLLDSVSVFEFSLKEFFQTR